MSDIETFLQKIMHTNALRMGGAAAGILGSPGSDGEAVASLKKASVLFANEYRNPVADSQTLNQLADEVEGLLRAAQLSYAISGDQTEAFIIELRELMERVQQL